MIFEINGKSYTYSMSRKGIRAAERAGMDIQEMASHPMLAMGYLWYAGIYATHPVAIDKAFDLLDEYLDSEDSMDTTEFMNMLTNDYAKVFGAAVE